VNRCVWLCSYWLLFFVWVLGIVATATKGLLDGPAWLVLAGLECLALWMSVCNVSGSVFDKRAVGLILPLIYLGGVSVSGRVLEGVGLWFYLAGCGCKFVSLVYLRDRFSIAGASWKSLVDSGPYRYIRHPQVLGRLLVVVGVAPSWSWVFFLSSLALAQIWVEEGFLGQFAEYREYADRVPSRLIPGVL